MEGPDSSACSWQLFSGHSADGGSAKQKGACCKEQGSELGGISPKEVQLPEKEPMTAAQAKHWR